MRLERTKLTIVLKKLNGRLLVRCTGIELLSIWKPLFSSLLQLE